MRKVQPKLRVVANGSTEVNALRSEQACSVAAPSAEAAQLGCLRGQGATPASRSTLPKSVSRGHLVEGELPDATVSVFVQLTDDYEPDSAHTAVPGVTASKGNMLTAEMTVAEAMALSGEESVAHVELGQPVHAPTPELTDSGPRRPDLEVRRFGDGRTHRYGEGVLIGVIDVGGFDFSHPDFLGPAGQTRFARIWDQGGDTHPAPAERGTGSFGYGSELRAGEMNAAIAAAAGPGGLPAHLLEPQSQMVAGSHGTHVASIAAGNRGICRNSQIAAVLISIPGAEQDRRRSFYDSSRIAHAVSYLLDLASELGDLALSINISLGTNGHAHDDSAPVSRWIDAALARPGRSVAIAAGNAGQERPGAEGDVGWIMGRVHASGIVRARELIVDLEWQVVGNGIADISENELELWYEPGDRIAVQVKPPGEPFSDPLEPGEFIENRQLADGSFLSVYNELYHASNGANYISVYLSPLLREPAVVGVSAGSWLIRLIGREVRDGRFHAWIERDDPRRLGRIGAREAWIFPSFFGERTFVDASTVSTLACGRRIVSVANLDAQAREIALSSSQGPTRDGRQKPDLAAPGSAIVAANGFADADDRWVAMSGTSMASPQVAGVIGLMLAANPGLTAAQIGGILKRTARPLPGDDFAWRDDSGAGVIDEAACVAEAVAMRSRRDVT